VSVLQNTLVSLTLSSSYKDVVRFASETVEYIQMESKCFMLYCIA